MATVDELLIKLDATTEGLRRELRRAEQQVGQSAGRMERDVGRLDRNMQKFERTMAPVNKAIVAFGIAIGAVAIGSFVRGSLDAVRSMERISAALRVATGSSTGAAQALSFVRDQANRLGLDLESAASAFGSLAAASRGTALEGQAARDIFVAVSEAMTALGQPATQTEGALRAIEQMISKGNVQAEELRGQLGERLPGAFQIAARAMGVTTQELNKMLDDGEVLAADLLPALAKELTKTFGPEAERMSMGFAAQVNRLNTTFFEMQAELGERLVPSMSRLMETLNQPEVIAGISGMFEAFAFYVGVATEALIGFFETWSKGIGVVMQGEVGDMIFGDLAEGLTNAAGGSSVGQLAAFLGTAAENARDLLGEVEKLGGSGGSGGGGSGAVDKALKKFKQVEHSLIEQVQLLQFQAGLVGKTSKEVDYLTKRRELLLAAEEAGLEVAREALPQIEAWALAYADAKDNLDRLNEAQETATRKTEEAAEAAKQRVEEFQREVESVAGSIADDLTEALFDGAETGFDNIFENIGTWLRRIALEILKQQIVLPITTQLVGSVPGLFGIAGGGGVGGAGGNGFNIVGSLGDAANQIGSWLGFGASAAGAAGGGVAGIGGIANSAIGGLAGGSFSGVASGNPSWFASAGGLGGLLGGAGVGAGIGGLLAGLTGGGSTGGTIGGGIGGALGTAAFGPVGGLVGGLLGGFIGGLFGGAPERIGPQSIFEIRGGGSGLNRQQIAATQGAGDPSGFGNSIIEAVDNLVAALGGSLGAGKVTTDVGFIEALGGLYVNPTGVYGDAGAGVEAGGTFFGNESDAARRYAVSTIIGQAGTTGIDPAAVAALQKSLDIRSEDADIEKDVAVIKLLFDELPEEMGAAEQALHDLNEAMDDAAKRARELGLAEAEVEAKRAEAIAEMKEGFLTSLADQILSLKDPTAFAIQELDRWKEAMIADAEALGVGLAEVEELYGLRRKDILERIGQQSVDSLQQFLEQITFGNLSGAAPVDVLAGSRAAFEAAAAQALAGDADARARIEELGAQFLEASRGFNASGAGFQADRDRVEEIVRALLDGVPGYASGIWDHPGGLSLVGERGPELMFAPPGAAILPNAISRMMAGAANGDGFGGGVGRELLKVASQQLGEIQADRRAQSEIRQEIARLNSRLDRLISRLPAEAA